MTDADFRKIRAHQIRKKMAAERKHQNDGNRKRTNDDALIDEEVQEKIARYELRSYVLPTSVAPYAARHKYKIQVQCYEFRREEGDGLPRLNDIEHFHKKFHRQTKEERKATVEAGREGREEFGRPKKKVRTPRGLCTRRQLCMRSIQ